MSQTKAELIDAKGDANFDSGTLYVDATNNRVGIGTTSPSTQLHIFNSTASANLQVESTFASGDARLNLYANSGGLSQIRFGDESVVNVGALTYDHTDDSLAFRINSSERARIDSSGRLLIGTSTSFGGGNELQVNGTAAAIYRDNASNAANSPFLNLHRSRNGGLVNNGDRLGGINFFGDDGVDLLSYGAQIVAEVDGTPGANVMPGRLVFSTTASGSSTPTERMRISNDGSIYIADTSSYSGFGGGSSGGVRWRATTQTAQCQMEGYATGTSTSRHILFSNPNGVVGSITTASSATAYNTSSDYRLKENIAPVTDGITRLQQLKPSRFNFIADPDTTVDGFIAHEAQAVVPECVTGTKDEVDENGDPVYQGIDQSKLVPLLTAALQEAIGRIETLEAEVAALKAQ